MKKGNYKKRFLLFFMTLCLGLTFPKVEALTIKTPTTLETGRTYIGLKTDFDVVYDDGFSLPYSYKNYPVISYKSANDTAPLLCATGLEQNPPIAGTTCTMVDDWSYSEQSYGIAYIIYTLANTSLAYSCVDYNGVDDFTCGVPDNTDMLATNTNYYYWMEMLTLGYMGVANNGSSGDLIHYKNYTYDTFKSDFITNNKSIWLGNNQYNWNDLINEAQEYADAATPTIKFSSNKLTFTKNGTNYESNWITVTGNNDGGFAPYIYSSSIDSSNIKIETNGTSFRVVVSNVVSSVEDITVGVKSGKTAYHATKYNCGSSYQEVVPAKIFKRTVDVEDTISGSIVVAEQDSVPVRFTKQDQDGNLLSGAVLHIKGDNKVDKDITFGTDTRKYEYLSEGTYTVTEKTAPAGCQKSGKTITLKIEDGESYVDGVKSSYVVFENECSIEDEDVTITIEKVDSNSKLIEDDDMKFQIFEMVNGKEEKIKTIYGGSNKIALENGKNYRIREVIAPTGYNKLTGYISFSINNNGEVSSESCYQECKNNILHITNTKIQTSDEEIEDNIRVTITKVDGNGKELSGAKLQLYEESNESIKYAWNTKDNNPYNVILEKNKTYILKETTVPEGYTGVKDAKIVVDKAGKVTLEYELESKSSSVTCQTSSCKTILVKNIQNVKVPDTLSSRSIILIVCGALLCLGGAGIGIYALKNKKED